MVESHPAYQAYNQKIGIGKAETGASQVQILPARPLNHVPISYEGDTCEKDIIDNFQRAFGIFLAQDGIQFAMCGRSGKYSPYVTVEPLRRQRILLLINSAPFDAHHIAEKLGLSGGGVNGDLRALEQCGLIKEIDGGYVPAFAIFTLRDQTVLNSLIDELSRSVSLIIEKRMGDVEVLISDLDCVKNGLKSSDLQYIIIGAMTLDYNGLRLLRDEKLLSAGKKMPGNGNYIFSGLESGLINLKSGWMWGHNSSFGKYWFSSHGQVPVEGFRMVFPDLAWQWAEHVEQNEVMAEMEKIGEILEVLTQGDFSTTDLKERLRKDEDRLLIELTLLLALEYVALVDKKWRIDKPFFTVEDLSKIRRLSDSILKEISKLFKTKQSRMLKAYVQTSPAKNGIPFEDAFNPLYHLIFERALNVLMENKAISPPSMKHSGARYSSFIAVGIENWRSILGLDQ